MQFRLPTELTAEEYVRQEVWKDITIYQCPIHPDQNCRFMPHGTYERVSPAGTQIVRYLCLTENITFSLLPDCFSSRLKGTLIDLEKVVLMNEKAQELYQSNKDLIISNATDESLNMASMAEELDVDQELFDSACDNRWIRLRLDYVQNILLIIISFFPEQFKNCQPTITSFQSVLGNGPVLIRLREITESKIHFIPKPVGLNPRLLRDTGTGI